MTRTDRGRTPPLVVRAKSAEERKGARAMKSIKERLKVHAEIVRLNRAKLDAFKRQQKKGGSAA